MVQSALIQKLPSNTLGRDFVIGDLHGCVDLLQALLKSVDFNTEVDRLFSVGDLVDRGRYSLRCLQLIEEPWFHAVMGNHEAMMLEYFSKYQITGYIDAKFDANDTIGYIENGGEWVKKYYRVTTGRMSEDFDQGLVLAASLPLLIVVGDGDQRFHVVHSELLRPDFYNNEIPVWLDSDIDDWITNNAIPEQTKERFYWGRALMQGHLDPVQELQAGLSKTFCGHTIGKSIRRKLSHICLDTGAYSSKNEFLYGLTLYNLQTNDWVSTSY